MRLLTSIVLARKIVTVTLGCPVSIIKQQLHAVSHQKRKRTPVTHAASALAGIHAATTGQAKRSKVRRNQSILVTVERAAGLRSPKNSCSESAKVHTCLYDVTSNTRGRKH